MLTAKGKLRLIADEGRRAFVYDDKTGATLAKLGSGGNPTVGIGRNLSGRGLSDAEIDFLFDNDVTAMWAGLVKIIPWLAEEDAVRSDVVQMVEFNTGNVFQFRKMLEALHDGDFKTAAAELLDSAAARQLPQRYGRMATALETGSWDEQLAVAPPSTAPWVITQG